MLKIRFGERNFKSLVRFDEFERRVPSTGIGMVCRQVWEGCCRTAGLEWMSCALGEGSKRARHGTGPDLSMTLNFRLRSFRVIL